MSNRRTLNLLSSGAALALVMALACGCSGRGGSDAGNAAAPAKVATGAPAPGSNALAAIPLPTPTIFPPAAANSTAAGASVQPVNVDTVDLPPAAQAINSAALPAPGGSARAQAFDPALLRLEVLLDRAGFSPGAIDGRMGSNLQHAIEAFAQAHGQTSDGSVDPALWTSLVGADPGPAVQAYRITADDEAGPFIGTPPKDYRALAQLPALSYSTPEQELAERFHMSPVLLEALNPHADYTQAGTLLTVAAPRAGPRDFEATRLEVDKSNNQVRVYDAAGQLVAAYPATVGSAERPAPTGEFQVAAVAPHPAYFYDPTRLTFTPQGATGKLRIAPGPNNPVGSTWIALTLPTYGIHVAPDATEIGKQQSHGCVRLTNWDAAELGKAVKKGVPVDFVGTEHTPPHSRRT
jgi:lipoprotein-anchoring transpeptidase ErfK/SrfK